MKQLIMLFAALFIGTGTYAQQKKTETVVIHTSAICGDCKERIENALNYTKGVVFAELNLDTKEVTVKYKPKKISLAEIKQKISETGYDADEVKAKPEAIEELPMCCRPGGEPEEH